jgi:hypothetical protein
MDRMRASDGGSSPRSRRLEHAAKQAPATSKHFNTRPPQASATTTEQAAGPCPPKARFLAGRAHHATNVTHLAHYPADSASRLHIVCSHRRLHLAGFTSPASPRRLHLIGVITIRIRFRPLVKLSSPGGRRALTWLDADRTPPDPWALRARLRHPAARDAVVYYFAKQSRYII